MQQNVLAARPQLSITSESSCVFIPKKLNTSVNFPIKSMVSQKAAWNKPGLSISGYLM